MNQTILFFQPRFCNIDISGRNSRWLHRGEESIVCKEHDIFKYRDITALHISSICENTFMICRRFHQTCPNLRLILGLRTSSSPALYHADLKITPTNYLF